MGVLIGLEDWRTDVSMLAHHLRYMQKNYWKTKYSVNSPRMRPFENGHFQPNVIMTDKEYVQLMLAFRLFDTTWIFLFQPERTKNFGTISFN